MPVKNILLFLFLFITSQANSQITTYLDIPYHTIDTVDQNLLSLDIYVPAGTAPKPIIIYIHGGGWVIGDKSVFGEKMAFFTDLGYLFVSVNYRLSPDPYELNNPNRVKYPQHPEDVARAISYILDQASNNGGDLDRVALLGHSAGAQIASLIMTDETFLQAHGHSPAELKCLCSLDTGGYDINLWLANAIQATIDLYTNAFSADPIIRQQASPAQQVSSSDDLPTTLLVHQNTLKREYINQLFADSLAKYGGAVQKISSPYDHGEINQKIGDLSDPTSTAYTQEIANWFQACLSTSVSTSEIQAPTLPIFPNPATEIVYLPAALPYQLTDLQGRVVLSGVGEQIDVRRLHSGLYMLSMDRGGRLLKELLLVE